MGMTSGISQGLLSSLRCYKRRHERELQTYRWLLKKRDRIICSCTIGMGWVVVGLEFRSRLDGRKYAFVKKKKYWRKKKGGGGQAWEMSSPSSELSEVMCRPPTAIGLWWTSPQLPASCDTEWSRSFTDPVLVVHLLWSHMWRDFCAFLPFSLNFALLHAFWLMVWKNENSLSKLTVTLSSF